MRRRSPASLTRANSPLLPRELPDHPYRFVPVPRRSDRRDGWTSDRQHAFIWALARLPSVAAAARSVGMSARSAHRLRDAPGAEAFAAAWDDALDIGLDAVCDTVVERATVGVSVPIVRRGVILGHTVRHNDGLLARLLSGGAQQARLSPMHQDAAYRRAVRQADRAAGAPLDWNAVPSILPAPVEEPQRALPPSWPADRQPARAPRIARL